MKASIIGAGIGGIALSLRLKHQGFDVDVFEKSAYTGGKLAERFVNGYRFDIGPSLFTMPELVEELFLLFGKNPKERFQYQKLDTLCHYFFENGKKLKSFSDLEKFAYEAECNLGEPKENILHHLKNCKEKYDLTKDIFIFGNWHNPKTFFSPSFWKGVLNVHKLEVFKTVHQSNQRVLKTPEAIQLFDRYATYNGSDPYRATATLSAIPNVEYGLGAFLPKEGMYQIPRSLTQLAEEVGVKFYLNTSVEEIFHHNKKVKGIRLESGEELEYDIVISNSDVSFTYKKLLKNQFSKPQLLNAESSTSAVVFNWGIGKEFQELGLHNIFFSRDYQKEFKQIFEEHLLPDDPTVYIFIGSKQVKTDAPEGKESWFVMINAPATDNYNENDYIQKAKRIVLNKLNRMLKTDIEPLIEAELILHPKEIQNRTFSQGGALYGPASNTRWSAFQRQSNKSKDLKGLYFVGGSVHPGGGIPLCLSSAKITADIIRENYS